MAEATIPVTSIRKRFRVVRQGQGDQEMVNAVIDKIYARVNKMVFTVLFLPYVCGGAYPGTEPVTLGSVAA
ncbi:hypothetical protein TNCV_3899981 [Trichonephila clavipes]|nr:hypothetical protein TNCV_3899981 [Trichonephila clavipes]